MTTKNDRKKERQHVTSGIFYCRDSAEINGSGSLQTSLWLDSDTLRNRQQTYRQSLSDIACLILL